MNEKINEATSSLSSLMSKLQKDNNDKQNCWHTYFNSSATLLPGLSIIENLQKYISFAFFVFGLATGREILITQSKTNPDKLKKALSNTFKDSVLLMSYYDYKIYNHNHYILINMGDNYCYLYSADPNINLNSML